MVGWEAPRFGSARIYTVVAETGRREVRWDPKFVKVQHTAFHNRLKTYIKPIADFWSLGNNTNIKLVTDLGGDQDYNLKVTICEDNASNENNNYPPRIAPAR
jgi:hypothetical protein